jgi:L-threonylcarbamoyladenylate synthase
MQHFFPAPLTVIVPVRAGSVAAAALAGGESIALRAPAHKVAYALIKQAGVGIAAPSANRSGRISPTCAAHVASEFSKQGLTILDGGECAIGLESTVVDCRTDAVHILRHGAITQEQIKAAIGEIYYSNVPQETAIMPSPGMLASHYAPTCRVRLNAQHMMEGEVALNFGDSSLWSDIFALNLSEGGKLEEAAQRLYAHLRQLDEIVARNVHAHTIAIAPIPQRGIGVAINDRLRRAAAEK